MVMAADPETGEARPRAVVDLIRHGGLHTMVAVTLADGTMIDTTDRHPSRGESRGEWVDAIDLQPGDQLLTADGAGVVVDSTESRSKPARLQPHGRPPAHVCRWRRGSAGTQLPAADEGN